MERLLGQLGDPLVKHVAADALPGRWLPLPEPLKLFRAERDFLDCDRFALAKLILVDLPLDVVRVDQAALVGAVGTRLEVLEQLVARLGVLEQVGDREQERLTYRPIGIVDGLHYDVEGSAVILSGAGALLAELAIACRRRGRRRRGTAAPVGLPEGQFAHRSVISPEWEVRCAKLAHVGLDRRLHVHLPRHALAPRRPVARCVVRVMHVDRLSLEVSLALQDVVEHFRELFGRTRPLHFVVPSSIVPSLGGSALVAGHDALRLRLGCGGSLLDHVPQARFE